MADGIRHVWATVMFCDVVESTKLSFSLTPCQLRRVMLGYYGECTAAVEKHGGTVLQYVGDGVLAVFGLGGREALDADNAVAAAHEIVTSITKRARLGECDNCPELSVRVSVASGWVVTGERIGQGPALQDGVFGSVPYLAAGLNRMARPNSVIVADSTYRDIRRKASARKVRDVRIKGYAYDACAWQLAESGFHVV